MRQNVPFAWFQWDISKFNETMSQNRAPKWTLKMPLKNGHLFRANSGVVAGKGLKVQTQIRYNLYLHNLDENFVPFFQLRIYQNMTAFVFEIYWESNLWIYVQICRQSNSFWAFGCLWIWQNATIFTVILPNLGLYMPGNVCCQYAKMKYLF